MYRVGCVTNRVGRREVAVEAAGGDTRRYFDIESGKRINSRVAGASENPIFAIDNDLAGSIRLPLRARGARPMGSSFRRTGQGRRRTAEWRRERATFDSKLAELYNLSCFPPERRRGAKRSLV